MGWQLLPIQVSEEWWVSYDPVGAVYYWNSYTGDSTYSYPNILTRMGWPAALLLAWQIGLLLVNVTEKLE